MRIAMCEPMPARPIDSATLSFGLVSIPVKIYSTSEPSHEIHFHLVHEGCGARLHQQYVCPDHGVVERSDMIKGYELTKGNFIELSREELKALEAVASDEISIEEFVPAAAVDPLFVERSYYLGAGKAGGRAYQLFRDALDEADLVAIASYAARGKQYIVELRAYETGLIMHQLRYPDEIKPWRDVPAVAHVKTVPAELALARQVIDHLRHETFNPARYKDEVKARVRALIATKAKGGEITAPPSVERPAIVDLMAALKASLGAAPAHSRNGKRAPAAAAPAAPAKHASRAPRAAGASRSRPAHGRGRAAGSPSTRSHANAKPKASPRRRAAHQ